MTDNRKATGSYYTPESLVDCLLDTALDPVIENRTPDGVAALLGIRLVDPSCGAGAFLVRAARRLALRVAQLRADTYGEPPEDVYRRALWDVIDHCIHGVDLNPYAVEVAKVVLWAECAYPGSACPFLEPNLQHGNTLLGADPRRLAEPPPHEAWATLTGDDPEVAKELKRRDREERRADRTR